MRLNVVLFVLLAAGGAILDLWSKWAVFDWLGLPGRVAPSWIVDGVFGFQTAVNIGAVFGIGAGQGAFFAAFSVLAMVGILLWMFRFGGVGSRWLSVALGMVVGGILGNLYDRLGMWTGPFVDDPGFDPRWMSGVRDWILFRIEGLPGFDPWPNFNIADSLLVTGACMLMIHSFFLAPKPDDAPPPEASAETQL